ncbi:MAG TPA: glycosyltransferase, partial [Sphingobacteriaceae bacterium]
MSLERLLDSFRLLDCSFEEVIVSDDGSNSQHLQTIKHLAEEYGVRLITTPLNKGLGNNINKGQDAVRTSYTLYVQEDFVPTSLFPEKLQAAVQLM